MQPSLPFSGGSTPLLWYQRAVLRVIPAVCAAFAVGLGTGCSHPAVAPDSAPSESASVEPGAGQVGDPAARRIDPGRLKRIHPDLPAGSEVADVSGIDSTATLWGLRPGWTVDPPQCGQLVAPGDGPAAHGLSSSGDGGLLYVLLIPAPAIDPALLNDCASWTMAQGRSTAAVRLTEAPVIPGALTVGMTAAVHTVVESGTETESVAHTYIAYLDGYCVVVTLIVDPGSPHPPLAPDVAADLLGKAVSALTG